ncbi:MAG TPA: PIN domain-containing protein [Pirellulaceae bacterium]|nr:PIN domain-containing protein [Pirellulaceae bacterium]
MIFVDTSHLVALALPKDFLHTVALAWSQRIAEPLLTTSYVLCEFMNSSSSPAVRGRAHGLLTLLESSSDFTLLSDVHEPLLTDGLDLHRRCGDKEWSLTDCISFVVMQRHGIKQALTHDHHFVQAGFEALLRRTPA